MAKLIFGCGYLGSRVARRWLSAGETVHAVTRSPARAAEFQQLGIRPIVADVARPDSLAGLPSATTVLYAIGFDRAGGHDMRAVYVEGLQAALDALPPDSGRLVYISSTSVYGQSSGQWIDEQSPCEPIRENGRVCFEAEQVLLSHPLGQRSVRLRLAGIYGPQRIPRRDALAAGEPIPAPSEGFLNLIHVDDAASVVLAAERCELPPPRLYNVSDGQPPLRAEYYAELARLIGGPTPRFVEPPPDSPAAQRALSDKRVSNRRLLAELQVELKYPSYREGLAAIVAAERE